MIAFAFAALLSLSAVLTSAAPTRSLSERSPQSTIPVDPNDIARQVPVLANGNLLITPRLTVQVDSGIRQGPDEIVTCTNPDGVLEACRFQGHAEKRVSAEDPSKVLEINTFSVFDIPESFKDKMCRLHFFLGVGDGSAGSFAHVFTILNEAPLPTEQTTFATKPQRDQMIARFKSKLFNSETQEDGDAEFELGGMPFPCRVGKFALEVVAASPRQPSLNWSLNKGLSIEVLGIPVGSL